MNAMASWNSRPALCARVSLVALMRSFPSDDSGGLPYPFRGRTI